MQILKTNQFGSTYSFQSPALNKRIKMREFIMKGTPHALQEKKNCGCVGYTESAVKEN